MPPPPEPPPLVISAPRAIRWTKVAEAWLSTRSSGPVAVEEFRNPILAQTVRGDRYAAVVFTDHVSLQTTQLAAARPLVERALPFPRADTAAIELAGKTAQIAVVSGKAHLTLINVNFETSAMATRQLDASPELVEMNRPFRTAGGWLIAGFRDGDLVSWAVADGAKDLPAPVTIAAHGAQPSFIGVRGGTAPDGRVLVVAAREPQPGTSDGLFAIYTRGRWRAHDMPLPVAQAVAVADGSSRWLLACAWGCEGRATVDALWQWPAPPTALDAVWRAPLSSDTRAFAAGGNVFLEGPDRGVYNVARQTLAPVAAPVLEGHGWRPRVPLVVRDQLCLFGGRASTSADPSSRELHGAACLDPATLAWTWFASDAAPVADDGPIGSGCERLGELAGSTIAACWTRHRVPTGHYDMGWSSFAFGLWRVSLEP